EPVAGHRGEAELPFADRLAGQVPLAQVAAGVLGVWGFEQALVVEQGGPIHRVQQDRPAGAFPIISREWDAGPAGEPFHRLTEVNPLHAHDEVEDAAELAARPAAEVLVVRIDLE